MSVDTLERAVRFAREFSISAPERKLRWTHYKTLLAVKDPAKRAEFIKKVETQNINTKQLRREVAQFNAVLKARPWVRPAVPVILPVVRGKLYTYQVIYPDALPVKDEAYIDLGFNFWRAVEDLKGSQQPLPKARDVKDLKGSQQPLPKARDVKDLKGSQHPLLSAREFKEGLKEGALVTTQKTDEVYSLLPANAGTSPKQLYTYKAYLERIIDGDTIWLNIDVGFNNVTRQKVRFNGIDAPEIDTPEGQKAKRFVEKALQGLDFFVIKTYKSDKYDRYLTDIFYWGKPRLNDPGDLDPSDPQTIATHGRYLNQDLLDAGLARGWS